MPNSEPYDGEGRRSRRQDYDDQYDHRQRNDNFESQYSAQYEDSSRLSKANERGRAYGRKGDRYSKRQELLNAVNHVLNEHYHDKALYSKEEFVGFLKVVENAIRIESDADRRVYMVELGMVNGAPVPAEASDEDVAQMFCDYARELYFFAGGTLICKGALEEYRDESYLNQDGEPFPLLTEYSYADDTHAAKVNPAPRTSEFVRDIIVTPFHKIFAIFKGISTQEVSEWGAEEYRSFYRLAKMRFSGAVLRDANASELDDVKEVYEKFDNFLQDANVEVEFRLTESNLEKFYACVDRATVNGRERPFRNFPRDAVNDGVLYGLRLFLAEAVGVDCRDEKTDETDVELLAIAKYVLKKTSLANREFHDEVADFNDFAKEMLIVGGAGAVVSPDKARTLFLAAGGQIVNETPFAPEMETKEPWKKSRADLVKKILTDEFPDGMELDSEENLETFRRLGREYAVDFFEEPNDDRLRAIISRPSALWQGKLYVLPDSVKKRLESVIDGIFDLQSKTIYYDALFEKNRMWLELSHVHDPLLLRALIAFYFSRFFFYERYFEPEKSTNSELAKLTREILRCWGRDEELKAEQLAGRVYVDSNLIELALQIDRNHFASRGDGAYVRVAMTSKEASPEDELEKEFARASAQPSNIEGGLNGKEFLVELNGASERKPLASTAPASVAPVKRVAVVEDESAEIPAPQKPSDAPSRKSDVASRKDVWAAKFATLAELDSSATEVPAPQESRSESRASLRNSEEKQSKPSADVVDPTKGMSSDELKERKKNIAETISTFDGFNLHSAEDLALFREKAAKKGVALSDSDELVLHEIQRVGFVCDGCVYVISKKTKERICKATAEWFAQGGCMIYYVAFLEKGSDWLAKAGISKISVLKNRFEKYIPDCDFYDEYFEVRGDASFGALSEHDKVKEEILRVWDGGTSKRVSELVESMYIPRDKIEEVLKNDPDFTIRSNGYWAQEKASASRKRGVSSKRKSSKKRSN